MMALTNSANSVDDTNIFLVVENPKHYPLCISQKNEKKHQSM